MNIRLIINLSLPGLLLGVLTSFGYLVNFEWIMWIAFWGVSAIIINKKQNSKKLLHAFVIGCIFSLLVHLAQLALLDIYLTHNPGYEESLRTFSKDMSAKQFILNIGILLSLVNGAVLLLCTYGVKYFYGRN
jgi:uncharacterized membrane protein